MVNRQKNKVIQTNFKLGAPYHPEPAQLSWTANQKFCKPTGMPGPIGVQILDPTEQYLTS